MKKIIGSKVSKLLVAGSLLTIMVPQAMDWNHMYAAESTTPPTVSADQLRQKLADAMLTRDEAISFTYTGNVKELKSKLQTAIDEAMKIDPYINYTIKSYEFSYKGTVTSADVTVKLNYRETKEQTAYVDSAVKTALAQMITPGMTNHEKAKVIHDWIVKRLKYDETLQKYTAYDGLSTGSTVCQGYALLAYKMLKQAGITNQIIEGRAGGQLHAWNLVQLDGNWYHMDTTWDDPTPDRPNEVSTAYYMLTDTEIRQDHTWTKQYPAASTSYRGTLNSLIAKGGAAAKTYKQLYQSLEYSLTQNGNTLSSATDIKTLASKAMKGGSR
ncbi:transglutaminase [Paenibacillus sp. P96]|uniref:Transglutaminase n=1 Tax=Paenibacillus zeirhizosphaerae TaxID=2987519 RepID=A0ABT9FTI2_9BACL|nr:transglutaminase domain-containing protein [Paenibacillus sp. P96]MDP4098047.1 transglutaminase [Paenibacillus sp. P96]